MNSSNLSETDLSKTAAQIICQHADTYIKSNLQMNAEPYFVRAVFRHVGDGVEEDHIIEYTYEDFGEILRHQLNKTMNDVSSAHYTPCWLTLLSSDGEAVLQHSFFAIVSGETTPIGFDTLQNTVFSGHHVALASMNDNLSMILDSPPTTDAIHPHAYSMALEPSTLISPQVGGKTTPSRPLQPPTDRAGQTLIHRSHAAANCALSTSLPRLQPSAQYVPKQIDVQWSFTRTHQTSTLQDTLLIEPSPKHHSTDTSRRVSPLSSLSPQREKLWSLGEKSMTRYSGTHWLEDVHC